MGLYFSWWSAVKGTNSFYDARYIIDRISTTLTISCISTVHLFHVKPPSKARIRNMGLVREVAQCADIASKT